MAENKNKNWQKIRFICSKCGNESWQEFDCNNYIMNASDLICDDCFEEEA